MDDVELTTALRAAGVSRYMAAILVEDRHTAGAQWRIAQTLNSPKQAVVQPARKRAKRSPGVKRATAQAKPKPPAVVQPHDPMRGRSIERQAAARQQWRRAAAT